MLPQSLVFVDTETTGLSVLHDRVIEIGILRIENGVLVDGYQTLINPQMYVSSIIEQLTGIKKDDLDSAPVFEDVQRKVQELLDGAVFVAHNVRFDYSFLKNEFKRCGEMFSPKHFCTAKLSRMLFPQHRHHNLDSIIQRFGFSCERRHRAFDDAKILWDFYQAAQQKVPQEIFEKAVTVGMKKPSLPQGLSMQAIDLLPESPGVYIFYGENTIPLYIGKSKNIRERVLSHFTSDHTSSKEMNIAQQIKHIETIQTCGELGALIKESQLIKEMQPLYNRKLRESRKLIRLSFSPNEKGYQKVIMETVLSLSADDIPQMLGIFRSQRQAKEFLVSIAKDFTLCEKLLGLEKTQGACFAHRLDRCKGACIAKEKSVSYNFRFLQAFAKYKLKSWPFDGPIAITEKNDLGEIEQFIIDKWCLIGHKKSQEEEIISKEIHEIFDLDVYKILVSFLDKANTKNFSISLM